MKKLLSTLTVVVSVVMVFSPFSPLKESPVAIAHAEALMPAAFPHAQVVFPTTLVIPAIKLQAPIQNVGLTKNGEMDVPSGKTNNVGWYEAGTVPGEAGSAVLDAHVFAAFSQLHNLKVGSDLYVATNASTTLHFKVTAMEVYLLAHVPLQTLFNQGGARNLNLITCAGAYIPAEGTYDHRLVVYTTLVEG